MNRTFFDAKRILIFLIVSLPFFSHAQRKLPKDQYASFLKQQWLIGIDIGTNFTQPIVTERINGITSFENPDLYDKDYNSFSDPGIQAGLNIAYYVKGLSFAIQPAYQRIGYSYESEFQWGDSPPELFVNRITNKERIDYVRLPLLVKYDLLKKNIKPYVFGGGYASVLLSATKKLTSVQEDYASGAAITTEFDEVIIGVDNQYENWHYGVLGGLGVAYDSEGDVRISLEFTYQQALTNIIDSDNRFSDGQASSLGFVYDDLLYSNLAVSLQFLFPLKYLSSQFKSI